MVVLLLYRKWVVRSLHTHDHDWNLYHTRSAMSSTRRSVSDQPMQGSVMDLP